MAFVPGYEHDLFISYAHVDDEPMLPGDAVGWVSQFQRILAARMGQAVGRSDLFDIWIDHSQLRGGYHPLDETIAHKVRRSALFLAVLSPGYMKSVDWCLREMEYFAAACGPQIAGRLFLIEKSPVDRLVLPPAVAGLNINAMRFWSKNGYGQAETLGDPVVTAEDAYFARMRDVVAGLERCAAELIGGGGAVPLPSPGQHGRRPAVSLARPAAGNPAAPEPAEAPPEPAARPAVAAAVAAPVVFLADPTDEVYNECQDLRHFLAQQGIAVVPGGDCGGDLAAFVQTMAAELPRARLFVQLLGATPARPRPEAPRGLQWLQYEAALAQGVEILQWRPELDAERVTNADHRALLRLLTVQADSLQGFGQTVMARLEQQRRTATAAAVPPAMIALTTKPEEQRLAKQLQEALPPALSSYILPFEGTAANVIDTITEAVDTYDALILIYGNDPGWLTKYAALIERLRAQRSTTHPDRPLKLVAIWDGPPDGKAEVPLRSRNIQVIRSRDKVDAGPLCELVRQALH